MALRFLRRTHFAQRKQFYTCQSCSRITLVVDAGHSCMCYLVKTGLVFSLCEMYLPGLFLLHNYLDVLVFCCELPSSVADTHKCLCIGWKCIKGYFIRCILFNCLKKFQLPFFSQGVFIPTFTWEDLNDLALLRLFNGTNTLGCWIALGRGYSSEKLCLHFGENPLLNHSYWIAPWHWKLTMGLFWSTTAVWKLLWQKLASTTGVKSYLQVRT